MKLFAYVSIMLGPAQIIMYDCVFVVQLISISFGTASEYVAYSLWGEPPVMRTLFPLHRKTCVCVWWGGGGGGGGESSWRWWRSCNVIWYRRGIARSLDQWLWCVYALLMRIIYDFGNAFFHVQVCLCLRLISMYPLTNYVPGEHEYTLFFSMRWSLAKYIKIIMHRFRDYMRFILVGRFTHTLQSYFTGIICQAMREPLRIWVDEPHGPTKVW